MTDSLSNVEMSTIVVAVVNIIVPRTMVEDFLELASCSGHVEEGKVFLSCMALGFKRLVPGTRFVVQLVSIADCFPAHNSGSIIYDR